MTHQERDDSTFAFVDSPSKLDIFFTDRSRLIPRISRDFSPDYPASRVSFDVPRQIRKRTSQSSLFQAYFSLCVEFEFRFSVASFN